MWFEIFSRIQCQFFDSHNQLIQLITFVERSTLRETVVVEIDGSDSAFPPPWSGTPGPTCETLLYNVICAHTHFVGVGDYE